MNAYNIGFSRVQFCLPMLKYPSLHFSHPLFILLEMLFEKCELATRGDDALTSNAFDEELQEFVRQREYDMNPILTNDREIDNLVS